MLRFLHVIDEVPNRCLAKELSTSISKECMYQPEE